MNTDLNEQLINDVEKRLANFLLELPEFSSLDGWDQIAVFACVSESLINSAIREWTSELDSRGLLALKSAEAVGKETEYMRAFFDTAKRIAGEKLVERQS